jgi:hypothetical protein
MNRNVRLILFTLLLAALPLCLILFFGPTRPGNHPISSDCTWVEDNSRPLNLEKRVDRTHLRDDAVTAEDVSIRWADAHFHLLREYDARQNECMETLFDGVAKHHGVDVALVRQYHFERDPIVDSAVIVGFGIVYTLVAYVFAGRIRRGFPSDEPGFWVMSVTMAIGVSLVGVMIGILWSIVIEGVRFNSGHLSYRMNRIPFRQHWAMLFVCGSAIFVLASLLRSRFKTEDYKEPPKIQIVPTRCE